LKKRNALPPDAFVQLLDLAEKQTPDSRHFTTGLLERLVGSGRLGSQEPEDLLYRYYGLVRQDQERVYFLITQLMENEALCAHIAADTPFARIRHQIALRLAHSSTVREGLSKSKSPVVLKQIARHATGEELVDALDRLAKRYPATAINLLNERSSNDGL